MSTSTRELWFGDLVVTDYCDGVITMEIKSDGTLTATTNGEDDGAGTWEETDSGINISDDTGETIDGTLEDGVLTINLYGVEIKMEKE
jgi:hypothetical protein